MSVTCDVTFDFEITSSCFPVAVPRGSNASRAYKLPIAYVINPPRKHRCPGKLRYRPLYFRSSQERKRHHCKQYVAIVQNDKKCLRAQHCLELFNLLLLLLLLSNSSLYTFIPYLPFPAAPVSTPVPILFSKTSYLCISIPHFLQHYLLVFAVTITSFLFLVFPKLQISLFLVSVVFLFCFSQ